MHTCISWDAFGPMHIYTYIYTCVCIHAAYLESVRLQAWKTIILAVMYGIWMLIDTYTYIHTYTHTYMQHISRRESSLSVFKHGKP